MKSPIEEMEECVQGLNQIILNQKDHINALSAEKEKLIYALKRIKEYLEANPTPTRTQMIKEINESLKVQ